jgi:hypothetical protein
VLSRQRESLTRVGDDGAFFLAPALCIVRSGARSSCHHKPIQGKRWRADLKVIPGSFYSFSLSFFFCWVFFLSLVLEASDWIPVRSCPAGRRSWPLVCMNFRFTVNSL